MSCEDADSNAAIATSSGDASVSSGDGGDGVCAGPAAPAALLHSANIRKRGSEGEQSSQPGFKNIWKEEGKYGVHTLGTALE